MPIDRSELNLYAFFRDVALRYQREQLGIEEMTMARQGKLNEVLSQLQAEYFRHGAIDYDDPDRIVAYTLHFAPKHAVIWKTLGSNLSWESDIEGPWLLNSIGPGPGSDIIGMLCGLPDTGVAGADIVGLEVAETWRLLFEIAREEFIKRTGVRFEAVMTNDPKNLHRAGQTIGSFVLSDAARGGSLGTLLQEIRTHVAAPEAWFLDFVAFTHPNNGPTYVNRAVDAEGFQCSFQQLAKLNLELKKLIDGQASACDPLYCKREVTEPNINLFTVRLR